jgi:predicted NodU family carbamoyl transferase
LRLELALEALDRQLLSARHAAGGRQPPQLRREAVGGLAHRESDVRAAEQLKRDREGNWVIIRPRVRDRGKALGLAARGHDELRVARRVDAHERDAPGPRRRTRTSLRCLR